MKGKQIFTAFTTSELESMAEDLKTQLNAVRHELRLRKKSKRGSDDPKLQKVLNLKLWDVMRGVHPYSSGMGMTYYRIYEYLYYEVTNSEEPTLKDLCHHSWKEYNRLQNIGPKRLKKLYEYLTKELGIPVKLINYSPKVKK